MRDILITLIIFGALPFCLMRPSIGVLVFSWLSYMNPHRLAWGFAYDFQFAKYVAASTFLGMVVSRESKHFPINKTVIIWIALNLWMGFTTMFAFLPEDAFEGLVKTGKIQLMAFVTLYVMGSKERITALVWVICLSLAFYGVKGGIFGIITGGQYRVWGPPGSFIEDNNSLALALIMTIPLMRFLQLQASQKYVKWLLAACMLLTLISVLSSQSRGALFGLFFMSLMFWFKSRNKIVIGICLLALSLAALQQMPDTWQDRMRTIQTYEQDDSAMSRLRVWRYTFELSKHRVTGAGFRGISSEHGYIRYLPQLHAELQRTDDGYQNAHSIWFGMLGQHGWPGLILFTLLIVFSWRTGSWVIRRSRQDEKLHWCRDLAAMLQVSLVGYTTTGTFLSMEYFDLYYHIVALLLLLQVYVKNETQAPDPNAGISSNLPVSV